VIAILLSSLLFNSKLSLQQMVGGVIVLAGVLIVALWRSRLKPVG
jgi:uncharacterized membrane protein